jgi:hypothetical protein
MNEVEGHNDLEYEKLLCSIHDKKIDNHVSMFVFV